MPREDDLVRSKSKSRSCKRTPGCPKASGKLAVFTTGTSGAQPERSGPRRNRPSGTAVPILAARHDMIPFEPPIAEWILGLIHLSGEASNESPLCRRYVSAASGRRRVLQ